MRKEILLVSNYFPPEKGAAPNRIYSLAESLGKAGYSIRVVCPLPNYPTGKIFSGYKGKVSHTEEAAFGKVTRLWIWPSNSSNKLVRLFSMLSFSFSLVLFFLFTKTPKTVFVQYSPVFVGFTTVFIGKLFSKKLILNISDLWPLAGLEMGVLNKGWYYSILEKIERYCYKKSDLIIGQSLEILEHVKKITDEKPMMLYRNIPNFRRPTPKSSEQSEEIKIVYAGLLGVAQGIYGVCQQISLPENISFHIYGAGPEAEKIKALNKQNIYFYGELEREELHDELLKYDIAFIPLTTRIYGSVPSKLFEYTLLGLPVLYFAGGEGGDIVKQESLGWEVPVNNQEALQNFIDHLDHNTLNQFQKTSVQNNSIKAFDFNIQFQKFLDFIEASK